MSTGLKANSDGSAAIQVGGVDAITLTSAGAASFVTSPMTIQGGSASAPSLTFSGDTNTGIFSPAADTIAFSEGGVESMRIDASGNLGLGVTPSAWGQAGTVGALQIKSTSFAGSGTNAYWGSNWYGGGFDRYITGGTVSASLLVQTGGAFAFYTAGAPASRTADSAITFTQAMTLDASGNLLVGTTSSEFSAKQFIVSAFNGLAVRTTAAANEYEALVCSRNGNSGKVATWWYNASTQVGNISVTASATAYNTSSDYRLKNTIAPMTGALAKVALLKPVTYKWNVDGSDGQGFIAHELAEVVPQCVTGEKDAVDADGNPVYQGIDTSFLVATLTAAIQELKAELDATKAEVALLKGAA